eukprot:365282-Chlamydomonas_euryale.AAC.15
MLDKEVSAFVVDAPARLHVPCSVSGEERAGGGGDFILNALSAAALALGYWAVPVEVIRVVGWPWDTYPLSWVAAKARSAFQGAACACMP